jgi:hypothetical protein
VPVISVRLKTLGHHGDAQREYAYGPAGGGLPDTHLSTFRPSLLKKARAKVWTVIHMKNDWKRVFSFY